MKVIETKSAPAPVGPYSQAIKINNFIFCSGQIALNPQNNQVISGDVIAQTKQVMSNIQAVLEASGSSLAKIVKTTIFLKNMGDFAKVNEVYASYLKAPFPARSTVEVSALPKGVDVEIEVIGLAE